MPKARRVYGTVGNVVKCTGSGALLQFFWFCFVLIAAFGLSSPRPSQVHGGGFATYVPCYVHTCILSAPLHLCPVQRWCRVLGYKERLFTLSNGTILHTMHKSSCLSHPGSDINSAQKGKKLRERARYSPPPQRHRGNPDLTNKSTTSNSRPTC